MTIPVNAPTTATDPVDAIYEILSRFKQFDDLVIEAGETETIPATEAVYECKTCGQEVVKSELETHAIEQHKAPANMPLETLGTRK